MGIALHNDYGFTLSFLFIFKPRWPFVTLAMWLHLLKSARSLRKSCLSYLAASGAQEATCTLWWCLVRQKTSKAEIIASFIEKPAEWYVQKFLSYIGMNECPCQSAYIFAFQYSPQIGTILTTYLWPLLELIFGLIYEYSLFRFPYSTIDRKRVWIMVRSARLYHWPLPSSSLSRDRINISVAGKNTCTYANGDFIVA